MFQNLYRHAGRWFQSVSVTPRALEIRGSRLHNAVSVCKYNDQRGASQGFRVSSRYLSQSAAILNLDPPKLKEDWSKPSFDVAKMTHFLNHDNHEKRAKFRKFVSEEAIFLPRYNMSLEEERDLALARLKKLCDNDLISVLDFRHNPLWIFAAHELGSVVDPAMTTKMTVQFNLFGGTVLKLGTERHHNRLLKGIDSLEDVGCFGLTELGYGNNAVQMETTAVYDKNTKEFIVNTPTPLAQKYWITNGACHAHHIIVFSQLYIDGVNQDNAQDHNKRQDTGGKRQGTQNTVEECVYLITPKLSDVIRSKMDALKMLHYKLLFLSS